MESGGTVLSTNWKDVGTRKVEMSPPDDVEFKKYWALSSFISVSIFDIIYFFFYICPYEFQRRSSLLCSLLGHPSPPPPSPPQLRSCSGVLMSLSVSTLTRPNHSWPVPCNNLLPDGISSFKYLLNRLGCYLIFFYGTLTNGLKCDWQTWNVPIQIWFKSIILLFSPLPLLVFFLKRPQPFYSEAFYDVLISTLV